MEFCIGDHVFKTKTEATNHIKAILSGHGIGDRLYGEELKIVLALLQAHPEYTEKAKGGVKGIIVDRPGNGYGGQCFHVLHDNGSTSDFSYRVCLNPKLQHAYNLEISCRAAIRNDIVIFKEVWAETDGTCAISGQCLAYEDAHVDHAHPLTFKTILQNFVASGCVDISTIEYDNSVSGVRFKDAAVAECFRKYHLRHANLRVINAQLNQRLGCNAGQIEAAL